MEYWQRYLLHRAPHHKIFGNIQRTLKETRSFPWANAECEWWWHGNDVLEEVQQSQSSTDTSMENSEPWWFLSISPTESTIPLTGISCQLCMILSMTPIMATHSWYSVHGWGSIYLGQYYQHKEFSLLDAWKSTWGTRKSSSKLIFS
jgi:hypothetical protein